MLYILYFIIILSYYLTFAYLYQWLNYPYLQLKIKKMEQDYTRKEDFQFPYWKEKTKKAGFVIGAESFSYKKEMTMKKTIIVIFTLISAVCLVVPAFVSVIAAEVKEYPLYAGKSTKVGKVQVTNDSSNIKVKFIVDDPWVMSGTSHVEVAATVDGIPQKMAIRYQDSSLILAKM